MVGEGKKEGRKGGSLLENLETYNCWLPQWRRSEGGKALLLINKQLLLIELQLPSLSCLLACLLVC